MTFNALPAKTTLADTYPNPTNAQFKTGIGSVWEYLNGLIGDAGTPADMFDTSKLLDSIGVWNIGISFSVASSALTATVKGKAGVSFSSTVNPGFIAQRSSTLGDADFNRRQINADLSLVISSGSTLGHVSATEHLLYWYLIDGVAGAQELAVSGVYRGLSGRYTTTAEGGAGAADSATVMYSVTARTNTPGRLIAITRDTQTTAGTWAAVPTEIRVAPFDPMIEVAPMPSTIQVLTPGATVTWNASKGRSAEVTLDQATTFAAPVGLVDGEEYTLFVIQDGTGGRTGAWNAAFKWAGGTDPTLSTGANDVDMVRGVARGGNLYATFTADLS